MIIATVQSLCDGSLINDAVFDVPYGAVVPGDITGLYFLAICDVPTDVTATYTGHDNATVYLTDPLTYTAHFGMNCTGNSEVQPIFASSTVCFRGAQTSRRSCANKAILTLTHCLNEVLQMLIPGQLNTKHQNVTSL